MTFAPPLHLLIILSTYASYHSTHFLYTCDFDNTFIQDIFLYDNIYNLLILIVNVIVLNELSKNNKICKNIIILYDNSNISVFLKEKDNIISENNIDESYEYDWYPDPDSKVKQNIQI
jgi:hypothetical protein